MSYEIRIDDPAAAELESLRAYDQRVIVDAIEEQLSHQPTVQTRLRKELPNLAPSFEYEPPVWQLRVGVFRVFYDVDDLAGEVHVRAVRRKKPHQRTEDIT